MNKFSLLYGLLLVTVGFLGGCNDDDTITGITPVLSIDSTGMSGGELLLTAGQTEADITVNTDSREWGVAVISGEDWCSAEAQKNNGNKVHVTFQANNTVSDRTAVILIGAGGVECKVTLRQKGYAPSLTFKEPSHLLNVRDTTITVTVYANIDYTVTIPDTVSSWITKAPDSKVAKLDTTKVTLRIAANSGLKARSAEIIFAQGELTYLLPIRQLGNEAEILVDGNPHTLAYDSTSLDIDVVSNVDYTVSLTDKVTQTTPTWIRKAPDSKAIGSVSSTVHFILDPNNPGTERRAIVTFAYGSSLSRTVEIIQQGYIPTIRTNIGTKELSWNTTQLQVAVSSDVLYNVDILGSDGWLSYTSGKPTTATAGTITGSTLNFTLTENAGVEYREDTIRLSYDTVVRKIPVRQLGHVILEVTEPQSGAFHLNFEAQDFTLKVHANTTFNMTLPDWITRKSAVQGTTSLDSVFVFSVGENSSNGTDRSGNITLSANGVTKAIPVSQPKEIVYPLGIARATASSYGPTGDGNLLEATYDNNMATYYNSNYGIANWEPQTLTYYFTSGATFTGITYYPRHESGANSAKDFDIYIAKTTDPQDNDFTLLQSYSISDKAAAGTNGYVALFSSVQEGVTALRIVVKTTYATTHFDCREIVFNGYVAQNIPYFEIKPIETVASTAGSVSVTIVSNQHYTLTPVSDWITAAPESRAALPPREEHTYTFNITANPDPFNNRTGEISVQIDGQTSQTIRITQKKSLQVTANTEEDPANEGGGNGPAKFLIDGNPSTYWHSKWSGGFTLGPDNPAILTFTLPATTLNGLVYYPRENGGGNGNFGRFEVYTKSTGESEYTLRKEANHQEAGTGSTKVEFDSPVTQVESVQIKVYNGFGGFASGSEIEFLH